jgi:hypothetical protein
MSAYLTDLGYWKFHNKEHMLTNLSYNNGKQALQQQ